MAVLSGMGSPSLSLNGRPRADSTFSKKPAAIAFFTRRDVLDGSIPNFSATCRTLTVGLRSTRTLTAFTVCRTVSGTVFPTASGEVELSRGLRTPQVCKRLGISEQTYYRWRKEYGGLRLDQAKRLKALEHENVRLKKLVADQALDNAMLKEVASGNF